MSGWAVTLSVQLLTAALFIASSACNTVESEQAKTMSSSKHCQGVIRDVSKRLQRLGLSSDLTMERYGNVGFSVSNGNQIHAVATSLSTRPAEVPKSFRIFIDPAAQLDKRAVRVTIDSSKVSLDNGIAFYNANDFNNIPDEERLTRMLRDKSTVPWIYSDTFSQTFYNPTLDAFMVYRADDNAPLSIIGIRQCFGIYLFIDPSREDHNKLVAPSGIFLQALLDNLGVQS